MEPRVTLLMPNRNNAGLLDRVLDRLTEHTSYGQAELIVVDDGSTDGSRELLRRWRDSDRIPRFRLIEREHQGVADALNAGLAEASGELVVQLDADATIETPGWLERMTSFFLSDERIGVVTAKVVFDSGAIHACGISVLGREGLHDRGTTIGEPVGRRTSHQRVVRPREDECPECERPAEVDGGIGCCMMFRRAVALEAGGYDPGFAPVWFDDLDLTISIRRLGYKVFYLPEVRVVHWLGKRAPRPARGLRRRAVRAAGLDRPSREHRKRLAHHYAYWRRKWGFDMLNPDIEAVRERWGETEVCWRSNPEMRTAGERIVAAHAERARA